jgi:hypothetical protein
MLKKATLKATVGTAAASLLFLPGATMVGGAQIAPMACNYPDSKNTVTQLTLKKPVMRRGQKNFGLVRVSNTDGPAAPKGKVTFRIKKVSSKTKAVNRKGKARFNIKRNLKPGTYKVIAKFRGTCKFRDSRDVAFLTVQRRR